MTGEPDPLYVLARRALLDVLAALEPHLDSIILIGAQAVYMHTGQVDLAVAEFTTDADLAIAPEFLADTPSIGDLLEADKFVLQDDPGKWKTADGIQVDLLVPDALAGPGRRGARIPGHGNRVARRSRGIEGALVDSEVRGISALDLADQRSFRVAVAGPAALFVAKVHKISERVNDPDRLVEKDALDVLRILRSAPTQRLAEGFRGLLDSDIAHGVATEGLALATELMSYPDSPGPQMAARAAGGLEDPDVVAASLATLWSDLWNEVQGGLDEN
ncbi:MAG TPA: hypothetical protein VGB03_05725 [Acidimicrobiales bacterium]|jgi:hypothetical protein